MQRYTLAVATRRFRNRLRTEIATQPTPPLTPTRLRLYHKLLAATDNALAQVNGVLAPCVHCGEPVTHGVEWTTARRPAVLCRRCVITAAELLSLPTRKP